MVIANSSIGWFLPPFIAPFSTGSSPVTASLAAQGTRLTFQLQPSRLTLGRSADLLNVQLLFGKAGGAGTSDLGRRRLLWRRNR